MQSELDLSERKQSQKKKVLNLLQERGIQGVNNYEIRDLGILSHSKRMSELYADGHNIKKEFMGKGVFKYILIPERLSADIE